MLISGGGVLVLVGAVVRLVDGWEQALRFGLRFGLRFWI